MVNDPSRPDVPANLPPPERSPQPLPKTALAPLSPPAPLTASTNAEPAQSPANVPEGKQSPQSESPAAQPGIACLCAAIGPKPEFPSAKNRAAKLAAQAKRTGTAQSVTPGSHPMLSAYEYAVALGKPRPETDLADQEVANAFAQAWAQDGDVLRYRGDDYREADAPPGMDSPAAAGWQPTAKIQLPVADRTYARKDSEQANQLFEAYGASYSEAYAVALAGAFSEDKPLPDDGTGDVTGLVSSIMHPPGGEPILLGSVYLENKPDEEDEAPGTANIAEEPPLSFGRKLTRALLLTLGAATVALACLYFTGYLL
jgi:hypothetical protein